MQAIRRGEKVQLHMATLGRPSEAWARLRYMLREVGVDDLAATMPKTERKTWLIDEATAMRIADAIERYGELRHGWEVVRSLDPFSGPYRGHTFFRRMYELDASGLRYVASGEPGPRGLGLYAGEQDWTPEA